MRINLRICIHNISKQKYVKYLCFKLDSVYPSLVIPNYFLFGRPRLNDLAFRRECHTLITLHKLLTGMSPHT